MLRVVAILVGLMAAAAPAHATLVWVPSAKITVIEVWGPTFTVYLNTTHGASGCGHNYSFALDPTTEVGKAMASTLLTAWAANKTIAVAIDDSTCIGDRPSVRNFQVYY